ncbi:hypothetical protein E6R60_26350 [Streptomyces sp. A0642]|uniref:hypothetical protein n=1 Tax=Streptomyces sp. A0642 TaxID=2563100 RepID=UPI0010A26850|nr:hypothetical protein [Streptomyces sp. A0642]THA72456.1 hypothetical protein E6R60_26350 [Streptomyces sp. A0642]
MATDIRRHHLCENLPNPEYRSWRDIIRCDDCDRFLRIESTWGGPRWRRVGRFTTWRLRRQIRLEGEKP